MRDLLDLHLGTGRNFCQHKARIGLAVPLNIGVDTSLNIRIPKLSVSLAHNPSRVCLIR